MALPALAPVSTIRGRRAVETADAVLLDENGLDKLSCGSTVYGKRPEGPASQHATHRQERWKPLTPYTTPSEHYFL